VSRFRSIDAEKTNYPVRMMCRLLEVSSSVSTAGWGVGRRPGRCRIWP